MKSLLPANNLKAPFIDTVASVNQRGISFSSKQSTRELDDSAVTFGVLVDRLPSELLSEIFICYLPDNGFSVFPEPLDAPLLLCSICRRWRTIATMSPRLWSSLAMDEKGSIPLAQLWL